MHSPDRCGHLPAPALKSRHCPRRGAGPTSGSAPGPCPDRWAADHRIRPRPASTTLRTAGAGTRPCPGVSLDLKTWQVVALEPEVRNDLKTLRSELCRGRECRVDRIDDDFFARTQGPQALNEIAKVNDLQQPATVRIELALDGVVAVLLDP